VIEMNDSLNRQSTIAIFGATGYIGLILTHYLAQKNYRLTLFVRDKTRLTYFEGSENFILSDTPLISDNLTQITSELKGVDVIYYLIHSMEKNIVNFSQTDNTIASIVGEAAHNAGVKQIIYVGGLGKTDSVHQLSKHLESRQVTAVYLKRFGVPLTEFRTGIVTGEGSASFEMIRTLSTKLPFIPEIPFNHGACQIIDIDDLIAYLDHALDNPAYYDQIIELGTDSAYSYNELVTIYAKVVKHRNLQVINFPVLKNFFTESVISMLISWFTRIPFELAKPLIAGMKSLAVVDQYPVTAVDPNNPLSCRTYEKSIINASSYRDEIMFENFWKIPLEMQFYIKHQHNKRFFSQYKRNGLFFSTLINEIPYADQSRCFENAKLIIQKNRFQHSISHKVILKIVNTVFKQEKLHDTASPLTLVEGSTCKEWRVAAISEREDRKFITLSSQFKGTGFLWFQIMVHEVNDQRAYLMLRLFFEPISIKGHLYWSMVKQLHASILEAIDDDVMNLKS
jgi:uncharacterized protein YbjT (DUF2867 family)